MLAELVLKDHRVHLVNRVLRELVVILGNKDQQDQMVLQVQPETAAHLETQAAQVGQELQGHWEARVHLVYLDHQEVQDLKVLLEILVCRDKGLLDLLVNQVSQETEGQLALQVHKVLTVQQAQMVIQELPVYKGH